MDTPEAVPADRFAELPTTWFRRRRRGRLHRALAALIGGIVIYSLAMVLLLPPLFFLVAGLWSVVTYARTLVSLWDLLKNGQLQAFLDGLGGVDLAVRLALASGAYFALLFALIVIFSALLARGWRLLLLAPGLLLGVPAALVFVLDIQAATDAYSAALGLSASVVLLTTSYILADLAVLAAFLTDLRPRLSRRRRRRLAAEERAVPLPLVRFGPSAAPAPFVVRALAATAIETTIETIDGPPSDPMMTATVAKALDDSLPVAILPVAPSQHDETGSEPRKPEEQSAPA